MTCKNVLRIALLVLLPALALAGQRCAVYEEFTQTT